LQQKLLVEMKNISKSFGAIRAVQDLDLTLYHDEILGLVGDNAAGKSTLMKVLSGAYRADAGKIFLEGKEVTISCPSDARTLGIEMVYQDFALAPNLDVVGNIFLGREVTHDYFGGLLKVMNQSDMVRRAKEGVQALDVDIASLGTSVRFLSGGQQQCVAIARATLYNPKVIIMDEPSASLSVKAISRLHELIRKFKASDISIIFISHRLPDVLSISDRIMVMRGGRKVAEKRRDETDLNEVVNFVLGLA